MRYVGEVGYGESVETPSGSGIWVDTITEKSYYGEVLSNTRQLQPVGNPPLETVNENIVVGNRISILADPYASENFANIKYVRWAGSLWIVTNVEVQRPRLILSLGSVYNGPTP